MRKELRPDQSHHTCDLCGRTMLKGERVETYLVQGGQRRNVCDLCAERATAQGWIRESAHGDLPAARTRAEPRRSLLDRFRRQPDEEESDAELGPADAEAERPPTDLVTHERRAERPSEDFNSGPKDPRHVRAVPTNAEVKVERALELFNASEHPRTIAGLTRTLGGPWVSAEPDRAAPSEVAIVVAWELSWYRFRVDLGDAEDPVVLVAKGEELSELGEAVGEWNAQATTDGRLAAGVGSGR